MSIEQPNITKIPNGYKFWWSAGGYESADIKITRLHEDSKGVITGEISVMFLHLDYNTDGLWAVRFNLMNTKARAQIAQRLREVVPSIKPDEWNDIIGIVCRKSVELFRTGEKATEIKDITYNSTPRYRIEPVVFETESNVLFGAGDVGKTKIAYMYAVMVQDGYADFNLIPTQGNVLILDWETSSQTAKETIDAFRKGFGTEPVEQDILWRYCSRPLVDDAEQIEKIIFDNKIEFVIVDSINKAIMGSPNDVEGTRDLYNCLRSFGVTALTIDHVAKNTDNSPFGSVEKRNAPRSAFLVKHSQEPEKFELNVALYHNKCNIAPKLKPFGYKMQFLMNSQRLEKIQVEQADLYNVPELADYIPLKSRIYNELLTGPKELPEIAENLGAKEGSVRTILNRNKGQFIRVDKQWGLKSNAQ